MPELPDITVYLDALAARILGHRLQNVLLGSPFLLRTAEPPLDELYGRRVAQLKRIGKRIAIGFDNDRWLLLHLMIAGRLHWFAAGTKRSGRRALAAFEFDNDVLTLTEAGTQRRASLHVLASERQLREHDRGGLEVLEASPAQFQRRLQLRNHTLKRALTDPQLFSGIGNAYSDEILHAARLSPVTLTQRLAEEEVARLYEATIQTLKVWTARLQAEAGSDFPEGVTAFRPEMAVHGRYRKPCPVCGTAVQRIRYATNETNYCPRCQTGGRVLADRSLSRLLKDDWPRSIEELEQKTGGPPSGK